MSANKNNSINSNTKIGIWGLGIVGTSVLNYVQQITPHIQILDKKEHAHIPVIIQTPETIHDFLEYNDIIIPSPGISLLDYQQYAHKFIHELDIFSQEYHGSTIAITGTLGKTTVTSFIAQLIPGAQAAGNIGYAMLDVLSKNPQPTTTVLELSSYQLQYAQNFAPDLAIWTNFYPNHLDHHATLDEYFDAKCMILKNQNNTQKALIPYNIIDDVVKKINPNCRVFLFSHEQVKPHDVYPTFYIENSNLILASPNQENMVIAQYMHTLPNITFLQNWVAIIAGLYLYHIPLTFDFSKLQLNAPEHRVELVRKYKNVEIYNDSKSTVWQATKEAIERFPHKKIALFLGGLSKGTDRTPLIEYLKNKPVTVFAFGKEAPLLEEMCQKNDIACISTTSLQSAIDAFAQKHSSFDILLFSPAGSSFDLFKNFEDRGKIFKELIHNL